uniref:Cytochrome c oxidase subunit 1 n=1 Tax=Gruberia lanceolata TaxID=1978530 RepID=A0A6C0UCG7_9CILI|nr:cytochrome c oxidase subunit 1 [Gruberia lanceolata]
MIYMYLYSKMIFSMQSFYFKLLYILPILTYFSLNLLKAIFRVYKYLKLFCREWFYTTNHKRLGLNYILFAAFSGLFGTTLSTLIRLELAQPGSLIFANNANAYHVTMAIHAIIMVFFLVTPLVFGGFGNYFLPIYVGARDVAYPRLNNFSLWILPAALITVLRTLWEGIRVTPSNYIYESNFTNKYWNRSIFNTELILLNKEDEENFNFKSYNFDSEAISWHNLYEKNNLNIEYSFEECNSLPIDADTLVGYLPAINNSADLTNTMAGWTFTTPFSHSRFTGAPLDWAMAGLLVATFSSILTLINLVVTWRYLRGRGSRNQKDFYPIALIANFISLRILIIVSPILNAGLLMLLADRHFYTAFFTVRAGGDILLFQHIFWFFGHPEVYILVMPAFGIASTLIPYYTRKPLGSKMHMVYAMHAIASMGFVVWGHHMYLVGIDNKARILFFVVTVMIGLPASVKVCGWVASLANSVTFLTVELLFAISFISFFVIGGLSGSFCAHAATDIMLHDTYYIVGHFHIMLSGSLMAMLFAYIYFNFKEFLGIYYNWSFAFIHCTLHFIGHILTFVPMLWLGYAGMPRRIQDYPWGYAGWHSVASLGHTIVLTGIFFFIFNICNAIYMKRPVDSRNKGFPFIPNRVSFLLINKHYSSIVINNKQLLGNVFVREYLNFKILYTGL